MVTVNSFLERYPVFEGVSEEVIEVELAVAEITTLPFEDSIREKATLLLTAHVLRLEYGDQIKLGANLRAIEEGSSIETDLVDLSLPYYQQTIYGQQFINLRKQQTGFSMYIC
jgi:hypothetical protein